MLETTSTAAAPAGVTGLPLRNDEVLGGDVIVKVVLLTVILLAGAYLVLRLYARRLGGMTAKSRDILDCESSLALSARTKAYVLRVQDVRVLVVESPTGSSSVVIGKVADAETGGSE